MSSYTTLIGTSVAEYTEKRSRFIATAFHCETEEEATAFIESMRSKYWDARHNVFAYSLRGNSLKRFSDDGEPHGTAGKPMLDVIEGSGITDVCVVVTRYFGGVLLGTGGLVRAYSKSTKDALAAATKAVMTPCSVLSVNCEYSDHQKLMNLIASIKGTVLNTEFNTAVEVKFYLRNESVDEFNSRLSEAFAARLNTEFECEKTFPLTTEEV